ncbi:MAG: hypothetical protein F4036_00030 [Gammaproteobacteria bacterium]|nr:hypothetical protein [Gammaproteobacteria bacterium]
MATKLYINYVRSNKVPGVMDIAKIHVIEDRHLKISPDTGGQIASRDFDFRSSPVSEGSQVSPNGYADIIYRYLVDEDDLHLWIAVGVPTNTVLPKPDYQEIEYSAAATVFLASGETDTVEEAVIPTPDWVPGVLTDADKKERVKGKLDKWREQVKHWLREAPIYATLVRDIYTHLGFWLRSADYTIKVLWDEKVAGTTTYDWSVLEAIIDEAIKGPTTLDPDGDGAYNAEFFMNLNSAISSFPNGPTFGALWVNWYALTSTSTSSDVDRIHVITDILTHADMSSRIKANMPDGYNPTLEYWET